MVKSVVLAVLCIIVVASTVNAAPFHNGGFEDVPWSLPGWSYTNIDLVWTYGTDWAAQEGDFSIDLNGTEPGSIWQTFDTTQGTRYDVDFWAAGNFYGGALGDKTANVLIDENLAYSFRIQFPGEPWSGHPDPGWTRYGFSFLATSSSTTLSFVSTTTNTTCFGLALDSISVNPVPEPSSMTALLLGIGGMIGGLTASARRRGK